MNSISPPQIWLHHEAKNEEERFCNLGSNFFLLTYVPSQLGLSCAYNSSAVCKLGSGHWRQYIIGLSLWFYQIFYSIISFYILRTKFVCLLINFSFIGSPMLSAPSSSKWRMNLFWPKKTSSLLNEQFLNFALGRTFIVSRQFLRCSSLL